MKAFVLIIIFIIKSVLVDCTFDISDESKIEKKYDFEDKLLCHYHLLSLLKNLDQPINGEKPKSVTSGEKNLKVKIDGVYYEEDPQTDSLLKKTVMRYLEEKGVLDIPKDVPFSLFEDKHSLAYDALLGVFVEQPACTNFAVVASLVRDLLNKFLFSFALQSAILRRNDTGKVLPKNNEIFKENPMNQMVAMHLEDRIKKAQLRSGGEIGSGEIRIDLRKGDSSRSLSPQDGVEDLLWYIREDLEMNNHHEHWHLVYSGPYEQDRRGESFYYMHNQMLVRYETERTSNRMPDLEPLSMKTKEAVVIGPGYSPNFDKYSDYTFAHRQSNTKLSDVHRNSGKMIVSISKLERSRRALESSIRNGTFGIVDSSGITEDDGIDKLGNTVEANKQSISLDRYGNYHNHGHVLLSFQHEPKCGSACLSSLGVMAYTSVSIRDPVFWMWHKHLVDDIFNVYKHKLQPYTEKELAFDSVDIINFKVNPVLKKHQNDGILTTNIGFRTISLPKNVGFDLFTFDRVLSAPLTVQYTQLNHDPFRYDFVLKNENPNKVRCTVRIFLVSLTRQPETQSRNMIQMDLFHETLNPNESKPITRYSANSTVTAKHNQKDFDDVLSDLINKKIDKTEFNRISCGLPAHLLLPRGRPGTGEEFEFVIHVTNYDDDSIGNQFIGSDSVSNFVYCGIDPITSLKTPYPDKRPMGFPFDRTRYNENGPRNSYWRHILYKSNGHLRSNVATAKVTILHEDGSNGF